MSNNRDILISVSNLSKHVQTTEGELLILQEINLDVQAAEVMVITGESGSGKTTLLGLMAGLDAIDKGEIYFLGESLSDKSEEERTQLRRGQSSFVFQSFHLIEGATALQNVMLPSELAGETEVKQRASEVLDAVGLSHRKHIAIEHLSGGEQQRVAIARAYIMQPKILFADEPTGNLDTQTGEQIINLLFQLRDEHQTTIVLVTHDRQLAAKGDRHIHLQQGRIVS